MRVVADDLRETLEDLRARLGFGRALAAPQIGAPIRMVHLGIDGEDTCLVNPEIVDIGTQDFQVYNDCFSFPDLMVRVQRAHHIFVTYCDLRGTDHTLEAHGELSELLQHELDHLDGVLAIDRATGLDPFCYREEWRKHHNEPRIGEAFLRKGPATTPFY